MPSTITRPASRKKQDFLFILCVAQNSKENWFYQSAAYSTDKGRTFKLINDGHGIVPNQGYDRGERDPKVFWHEQSKKWIMILWIKRGDDTFSGPDTGPGIAKKWEKFVFLNLKI